MSERILIGVAWPYANGPLHMGHIAGCYLAADNVTQRGGTFAPGGRGEAPHSPKAGSIQQGSQGPGSDLSRHTAQGNLPDVAATQRERG